MSTGLFLLCATTVAVLAALYHLTDEPLPSSADQSNVANKTGPRAVSTLQLVFVVTRHGKRSPIITYPSSKYHKNNTDVWPHGIGGLTNSGRNQLYELGAKFRSLYNGFLSSYYRPDDFKALSTPKLRSLQSAELFLAGLFPPTGFQVWNKHLLWQPVPVFPNLKDHYEIAAPRKLNWCPKFQKAKIESLKQLEIKYGSNITKLFQYVIPYTGYENQSEALMTRESPVRLDALYAMYESFSRPESEGFPIPAWSYKIYPQPLLFLFSKYHEAMSVGSYTQIRYLQGELFQSMVEVMRSKINKSLSPDRRMYFYSGHEFTVLGLLRILGLDGVEWVVVKTGASLILELHSDPVNPDNFYVQLLYIDGASPKSDPSEVNIPGCEYPCDFHLLANITEKYYNITDWERECSINGLT